MNDRENRDDDLLYSAELRHADGEYLLTINDHRCGEIEVFPVSRKAVKRIPFYLSALRGKLP
ncbi:MULTISPECIES: hypothetical protein [unclassified Streptomyces]|uniref:hypothetical protein n=1 Tax=unclassified Streptomyces TaxID=2593676 RepID=UPI000AAD1108|nr:hypothetical protein [Streptomyces sp. CNQ-509]